MQGSGKLERKRGLMHFGAAICFLIAMLLYAATSGGAALAFGLLGACFEAAGWYQIFTAQKERRQGEGSQ